MERSLIEARILERLLHVILADEHIERLVELTNEYLAESSAASKSMERAIEKELGDVRSRLRKHYDALETGELSLSDLAPRIKQLRSEEQQLVEAQVRPMKVQRVTLRPRLNSTRCWLSCRT